MILMNLITQTQCFIPIFVIVYNSHKKTRRFFFKCIPSITYHNDQNVNGKKSETFEHTEIVKTLKATLSRDL